MSWRVMTLRVLVQIFFLSWVFCTVATAESPKPFPNFDAKRVKPPKPGAVRKNLVQILEPEPEKSQNDSVSSNNAGKTESGTKGTIAESYGWFWDGISPAESASGPGRLEQALNQLSNPPAGKAVRAPRLQALQGIATAYGIDIMMATVGTRVSPALVLAVMSVESGGKADAVSAANAQGLMQLMPATAERFGVTDITNAQDNIRGGVRILDFLMARFENDPILVLAAYNAGETAIRDHQGVPPFAETRDYVPKVLAGYIGARGLCKTMPQLMTDGCVFVTLAN